MKSLSILLLFRNRESMVAQMVRNAVQLGQWAQENYAKESIANFEVLALDECSKDNTLSILSLLHQQIPQLRTLQKLRSGTSLKQASQLAWGRKWIVVDRQIDLTLAKWAFQQIVAEKSAAIVPGEVLGIHADVACKLFSNFRGGLVSAQHTVKKQLTAQKKVFSWKKAPHHSIPRQFSLHLRGVFGAVGLGRFDRPMIVDKGV